MNEQSRAAIGSLLLTVLLTAAAADPVRGDINNGFNTEYLYGVQTAWKDDKPDAGDVLMFNKNTGAYVGKLIDFVADPDPDKQDWGWEMITFAYDGNGSARLFVARRMDRDTSQALPAETYRDIEIAEYTASGSLVKKVQLANTFLGTNHLGERVRVGCIRFSTYAGHADSLFIAALTRAPQYLPARVYEVNLNLTTLKNTYTGPSASDSGPRVDFDPSTGRMFMVASALNEPTQALGRGDLVAFNYAPAGTNPTTWTTLINGKVLARRDDPDTLADPGFPKPRQSVSISHQPIAVVYRGTDHEDGRKTLLIPSTWNWDATRMPCNEYYLDQSDAEGNLVRRGTFYNNNFFVSSGSLDRMTGSIWLARLYGYNSSNGFVRYDKYDKAVNTGIGANRGFSDVAIPGLASMGSGWVTNNGAAVVSSCASVPISQMPGPRIGFEDHVNIHANAYHLSVTEAFANELDPVIAQGQAEGKPVIVSDDNSSAANVTRVQEAIARTAALGEHYEHYDIHLGGDGRSPASGPRAHFGDFISTAADFPAESKQILTTLGTHASPLTPGGRLTVSGHEFLWDGQPVTLAGSSWFGALVAKMCDVDGYLDVLASYHVNLTRVWCIEQWTATANGAAGFERAGWLPYDGYKTPDSSLNPPETRWNLYSHNDQYFARVKEFVRKAAARGIVVQLTLFDRFGVQCSGSVGMYTDSPYYDPNNLPSISFLTCSGGFLPFLDLSPAPIWTVNQAFIQRMVSELNGYGNVIFEIMNEPHNQWPQTTIVNWHKAVADAVVQAYNSSSGSTVLASTDLGDPDVNQGMALVSVGDGDTQPATIGGRSCRRNLDPNDDPHFYFGLDQALNGTRSELFVTTEYYDTGSGSLALQYDSMDSAPFPDDIYKNGGQVALTGSDTWKSHTFRIVDARFAHRQNGGADFRILHSQPGLFYLDVVTVRDLGVIQPPAPVTVRRGETAVFNIVAGGTGPITYRWQRNGNDLSDGGSISGATSDTLQINNAQEPDEGNYRCIISHPNDSVPSAPAALKVSYLGDFDADDDVDMADFGAYQLCLSRTEGPYPPGCQWADFFVDGGVDATDTTLFLQCLNGANVPPACE